MKQNVIAQIINSLTARLNRMEKEATPAPSITSAPRDAAFGISSRVQFGETVDPNLAQITFTSPQTKIRIFYDYAALKTMEELMVIWFSYLKEKTNERLNESLSYMTQLIEGWDSGKLVEEENFEELQRQIDDVGVDVVNYKESMLTKGKQFDRINAREDLVDSRTLTFNRPTDTVRYVEIYARLFKKMKIFPHLVNERIQRDMQTIRELQRLVQVVANRWNDVGKGDEFDQFREECHKFFFLINRYANDLENDLVFLRTVLRASKTTPAFKLYPWEEPTYFKQKRNDP